MAINAQNGQKTLKMAKKLKIAEKTLYFQNRRIWQKKVAKNADNWPKSAQYFQK